MLRFCARKKVVRTCMTSRWRGAESRVDARTHRTAAAPRPGAAGVRGSPHAAAAGALGVPAGEAPHRPRVPGEAAGAARAAGCPGSESPELNCSESTGLNCDPCPELVWKVSLKRNKDLADFPTFRSENFKEKTDQVESTTSFVAGRRQPPLGPRVLLTDKTEPQALISHQLHLFFILL